MAATASAIIPNPYNPMDAIILTLSKSLFIAFLALASVSVVALALNGAWRIRRNIIGWIAFREAVQYFKQHQPERWAKISKKLSSDHEP